MKNLSVFALGLIVSLHALSQVSEKNEDDQYMQAQTFHIMFATERDAANARARLDGLQGSALLSEFRRLAKQLSKDPDSSPRGGDLGIVKEGEMGKSFETALFALPEKTLSEPVKSEFGWHLIYAAQIYRTPVSEVCEQSLGDTIRRAKSAEREQLQATVMLLPSSEVSFSREISKLLGDGWGAELRDASNNVAFMRVVLSPNPTEETTVTMHKELRKAVLTTSPLACKRSERVTYAVNCTSRSVASVSFTQFEGRAALGRRLVDIQVPKEKRQMIPVVAGSLALQIVTGACGAEVPRTTG